MSRSLTSILDRDSRLHDTGLDQALEYHSLDDALTILRFQLQHPQPLFNNTLLGLGSQPGIPPQHRTSPLCVS